MEQDNERKHFDWQYIEECALKREDNTQKRIRKPLKWRAQDLRYVSLRYATKSLMHFLVQIPNYLISFDIKRVDITNKCSCIRKTEFGSNAHKRSDGLRIIRNDRCSIFFYFASSLPRKCGIISKYYREPWSSITCLTFDIFWIFDVSRDFHCF